MALEVCQVLMNNDVSFPVLIASSLPEYDGMVFKSASGKYVYNGQAAEFSDVHFSAEIMEKNWHVDLSTHPMLQEEDPFWTRQSRAGAIGL